MGSTALPGGAGAGHPTVVTTTAPTRSRSTPPQPPATHGSTPVAPPVPPWTSHCTYYSGNQETDYGATGARVTEVQCILVNRGYSIGSAGVDGEFGADTEAAVKRFQAARGSLEVDGQVGPQTWAALRSSV